MEMLLFVLLSVSQHALAVVVEVNEGERSVLLPCLFSGSIPEDSTVMWTRSDLDPKYVHGEGGADVRGQNQRYSGRTSMNRYALIIKDFSLTLRKPTKTDSSNYTCSVSAGGEERTLRDIQLQVKDQQVEVKVEEGSQSVILPCNTTPDLPEDTTVEWTRSDLGVITVHEYSNRNDDLMTQDEVYRDRTTMNEDLLRTGDLSLTLKQPTERDSGRYICTIYRGNDILRQKVVLHHVREPFPSWATALLVLLVLLVLLLLVSGGLLFYFRQYFMSDYKVKVDSGVESVQLPCKAMVWLPKDAKVEWRDSSISNRKVHVSDQPEDQHEVYRNRTEMKRNLLKPGDVSLTLKHPTDKDTNTYTCTVYIREGHQITKTVELTVKVPQVEVVDSGVEFVQLPCNATVRLPEGAKVEWTDSSHRKVHVCPASPVEPEEQFEFYRARTKMNINPLTTGDLGMTLTYPTDWDGKTYTCTVYNEGNVLMKKQVELKVRVCQVEVEEGAESVELPFKTTENLPAEATVVWWDIHDRKVHVYQAGEQDEVYRDRTTMKEEPLKSGDLSLTLRQPTGTDSGTYRCKVYGKICRYKKVQLKVKDRVQVQDQTSGTETTPLMADRSV